MTRLSLLNDVRAVVGAIEEFAELGREGFLQRYGFAPSREYFLRVDGALIDTKPLVAAAYRRQFPDHRDLLPADFSGGVDGAAKVLRRLGFEVVTRAQARPPVLGDSYASRTSLYEQYGGDKVAGIVTLPGDSTVNVFSDADGPYDDDPPTLVAPFGYRGEGLSGPQELTQRGNAHLERARTAREPVRFWYRPVGGTFSFLTWCVVLGRTWIDGRDAKGRPRVELEWMLEAVPGPASEQWPAAIVNVIDEADATTENHPSGPEAAREPTYAELLARVEARGQGRSGSRAPRVDYARSAAARRAVLIRSGGQCESARCTGMPGEPNRQGEPILDVDHIRDLARGGADHPLNMVALCPNCHASKTRGAFALRWRSELARVAAAANARALDRT
ncbi:HNH endonuclease [Cellulomonas sp. NPDC058312]|uniref:HNH endonuclease n=1 Tax=Cellulomonas sp. NPDC058312 TaxID=3346441 RepID=UPI0036E1F9E8